MLSTLSSTAQAAPREELKEKEIYGNIDLQGVIGFNGGVRNGLILHPGDRHLIYPLGSTVVVRDVVDNSQTFLQRNGHTDAISALALSSTGKYLASGQVTHMGFQALVIIWNLETYEAVHKLVLHKGAIKSLAFSHNEKYLATLGGRDDNKLVIWDVASGQAICGAPAANETAHSVKFFNTRDDMLVTGGSYNLRVWAFDLPNRKIRPTDCQLGQLKRVITSISINADDTIMYASSQTGDVMAVTLSHMLFKHVGPKRALMQGVQCTMLTYKGNLVVGSGDGTVALLNKDTLQVIRRTKVLGGVSSLALNAAGDHFFVGTDTCNIYLVHLESFEYELRTTCHQQRINSLAFPRGYSQLFATASMSDIRIWHAQSRTELLRIQVPNLECLCVAFSPDGKSIVSGWDDGKIRAFGPQSGKQLYIIHDAHNEGVTAIAVTSDGRRIVSGGQGGQVRVWEIGRQSQRMLASMKEHKGRVNSLMISADDSECVSASADGSCIVWSLTRFVRLSCLFASTQFKSVLYHPDQSQILTTGTDRKLTYWDVVDAAPIRILDGSATDAINALAISADGECFVSGGGDRLLKLYGYDEGVMQCVGLGHSGAITAIEIAPDQRTIVSVGEEGAIFIWNMPSLEAQSEQQFGIHAVSEGDQMNMRAGGGDEHTQQAEADNYDYNDGQLERSEQARLGPMEEKSPRTTTLPPIRPPSQSQSRTSSSVPAKKATSTVAGKSSAQAAPSAAQSRPRGGASKAAVVSRSLVASRPVKASTATSGLKKTASATQSGGARSAQRGSRV